MSSLKFGTSGLRGLADELTGAAARRYVAAFLAHLGAKGQGASETVFVGWDFRPSSLAIAHDCAAAILALGLRPVFCGTLPTPALALHAMAAEAPAIMVTGSHIPADRNGLKFYRADGEISKADEAGILANLRDDAIPDRDDAVDDEAGSALERYIARCAAWLPQGRLGGLRVGIFEHSSVARGVLGDVMRTLGAEVVPLGRVEAFVAVDTEAFGDPVFSPLAGWVAAHRLDALVSADGDGDRPLVMDERGRFVRGDVLGVLAARLLGADGVVTPVTSNSAIERTGYFPRVLRTKVGSPHVIEGLEALAAAGAGRIVGFEANGGTLVGNALSQNGVNLDALPTRDAVLPILAALGQSVSNRLTVGALVDSIPVRPAAAGRLADVEQQRSLAFLRRLEDEADFAETFFGDHGPIASRNAIDGLQFTFAGGDMVHYRPSGNAPELRCYVEAASASDAVDLLAWGLEAARLAV